MGIKNIIKKWLGTQEDISHAEEKIRKEVTEKLTLRHKADMDEQKTAYDALEAKLNEANATIKQMEKRYSARNEEAALERKQLNDQLLAEKDATAKRLEAVGSEINHAIEDTRKQVTEKLTAERDAAVQKVITEKDAAIAALQEKMKKEEEQWQEQRKRFSNLEIQLTRYKEAGEKIKAIKSGPGRPRKNRMRYEISLDRELKETITLLEKSDMMKHGTISNHINEELWEWLHPMREVLYKNQIRFEEYTADIGETGEAECNQQADSEPVDVGTPSSGVTAEVRQKEKSGINSAAKASSVTSIPLLEGHNFGQGAALTAL